jgi:hypothetical protein
MKCKKCGKKMRKDGNKMPDYLTTINGKFITGYWQYWICDHCNLWDRDGYKDQHPLIRVR